MTATVVRLPDFDPNDGNTYVLNWVGLARRDPAKSSRYQVFVRFLDKAGKASSLDWWVSFLYFPFLILGSEWHRGVMVGKPTSSTALSFEVHSPPVWHLPSKAAREGYLCFGEGYPLAFDTPAAPVLEIATRNNEILYVPLSEILRAHYFFLPRAIPSLLGGLIVLGHMAVQTMEAWRPDETRWIDKEEGIAKIHRSRFITDEDAKRLARLIFDPIGESNLKALRHWVEVNFTETQQGARSIQRPALPRLTLPYPAASWRAATCLLPPSADGRRRRLVLQILDFEAPEPYRHLHLDADDLAPEGSSGGDGTGNEGHPRGKVLEPQPLLQLPADDGHSDDRKRSICLDEIISIDSASVRRQPIKPRRDRFVRDRREPGERPQPAPVASGGLAEPGPGGDDRAPVIFNSEGVWPHHKPGLAFIAEHAVAAVAWLIQQHRAIGIQAEYRLLPENGHAYSFVVPKDGSEYAISRAVARQFLVVEVRIAGRHAYVVEPEQRLPTDSFPLGIWATRPSAHTPPTCRPITLAEIERIATCFEMAHRGGWSWLRTKELKDEFEAIAVRHAPRDDPSDAALEGFRRRIVDAIARLIGDMRILAQTEQAQE